MAKKGGQTQTVNTNQKTSSSTNVDPQSQAYIDAVRSAALGGAAGLPQGSQNPLALAQQYFNPYEGAVVDSTRADFDRARGLADTAARQDAAAAGAFGDDRASLARGARLGEVDRGEAQALANLRYQGYNNALNQGTARGQYLDQLPYTQLLQRLQALQSSLGPVGTQSTGTQVGTDTTTLQKHGGWGDALQGIAGLGLSLATGGAGAAVAPALGSIFAGQQPGMAGAAAAARGNVPPVFQDARLGLAGGYGSYR